MHRAPIRGRTTGWHARASRAGVHYVDLADARGFVAGIGALDEEARQAGVLVVSGASTVPALSAAVVDALCAAVRSAGVVPASSSRPATASIRALPPRNRSWARSVAPSRCQSMARTTAVHGWQGLQRRHIPGLGGRWLGACDTPDLELFPQRYPGLRSVQVFAALEVGAFHLGPVGLVLARARRSAAPARAAGRAAAGPQARDAVSGLRRRRHGSHPRRREPERRAASASNGA